jgi:hypothetical protein
MLGTSSIAFLEVSSSCPLLSFSYLFAVVPQLLLPVVVA